MPSEHGNSSAKGKFRSSAWNSAARGKLWAWRITVVLDADYIELMHAVNVLLFRLTLN